MILPAALHQTDARTTFPWDSLIVFLSARLFRCESSLVFTLFHYELFTVAIKQQTLEDTILDLKKLWSQVFSALLKVLSINPQISWWWRWWFVSKAPHWLQCLQSQIHAVMLLLYQPAADWDRNPSDDGGQRSDGVQRQSMWLLSESFPPCVTNEKQTSPDRLLRLIVIYMYQ